MWNALTDEWKRRIKYAVLALCLLTGGFGFGYLKGCVWGDDETAAPVDCREKNKCPNPVEESRKDSDRR